MLPLLGSLALLLSTIICSCLASMPSNSITHVGHSLMCLSTVVCVLTCCNDAVAITRHRVPYRARDHGIIMIALGPLGAIIDFMQLVYATRLQTQPQKLTRAQAASILLVDSQKDADVNAAAIASRNPLTPATHTDQFKDCASLRDADCMCTFKALRRCKGTCSDCQTFPLTQMRRFPSPSTAYRVSLASAAIHMCQAMLL